MATMDPMGTEEDLTDDNPDEEDLPLTKPTSLSTGHQALGDHSDEEVEDYNVYNAGGPPKGSKKKKKKKPKKHKKSSEGEFELVSGNDNDSKPTTSYQHDEVAKHQRRKKYIYYVCGLLWTLIVIGLIIFLVFYFKKEPVEEEEPERGGLVLPDTTFEPIELTTLSPTLRPTLRPTQRPNNRPTPPTFDPTETPTDIPSADPTIDPTPIPTSEPTTEPTTIPTVEPTVEPTTEPTTEPTGIPTTDPTNNPTTDPTEDPTINPTKSPSIRPTTSPSMTPTAGPSISPTASPSSDPTVSPSTNPTASPTADPTTQPTTDPTTNPSKSPTNEPSESPSNEPSISPTNNPSIPPTLNPSDAPTTNPTQQPTASPLSMILRAGSTVYEKGITMTFPPEAFPDSWLIITIGPASADTAAIFADTTSAFQAMEIDSLDDIALHFTVENMPLPTPDIVYETNIPVPASLLSLCPAQYGYEIFVEIEQTGFNGDVFSLFVLFESTYDVTSQSLTTQLFPEMFKDFQADLILSCTPGKNVPATPPAPATSANGGGGGRRLMQNKDYVTTCKATPIICPLSSKICEPLKLFGRDHYGTDYAPTSTQVVAVADGVIERSDSSLVYNELIVIRHDDGSATVYGWLESRASTAIFGANVTQGTVIGNISTHLHFEYIPNGQIYATKKRINAGDCMPANPTPAPTEPPTTSDGRTPSPTPQPSKSPLVPPSTHPPTPEPTPTPLISLPEGSITVRDSGRLADDSFAVYIDGFRLCETEIGQLNTCAINFLRPGVHTLTLEVLIAPDGFGTWYIKLNDGWTFTDGTIEKDVIQHYPGTTPPAGWKGSWDFIVPVETPSTTATATTTTVGTTP